MDIEQDESQETRLRHQNQQHRMERSFSFVDTEVLSLSCDREEETEKLLTVVLNQ
jgi:hypothetical protein